jgi:plastocyanin
MKRPTILLLALALGLSACGGGGSSGKKKAKEELKILGKTVEVRGRAKPTTGKLSIELDDSYFKPNVIAGSAGKKLSITFENEGKATHNFSLAAQKIDKDVKPGATLTITVTFPAKDRIAFFCKYHKDSAAMIGVLRVAKA